MKNLQIRKAIKEANLYHYEVADALKIAEPTFVRWLRTPLSAEKEKQIMTAIDELKAANDRKDERRE